VLAQQVVSGISYRLYKSGKKTQSNEKETLANLDLGLLFFFLAQQELRAR
jgi:hypothetical protein